MLLGCRLFNLDFFTPPSFWKYLSLKYGKNEIIDTWNFFGKFKLTIKIFLTMRCSCFCQSHSPSYVKKWNTKASVFSNEGWEGHCFSLSLGSPQDGSIEIERCLGRLADGTSKCLKTIPVYNKESVVLYAVLGHDIQQAESMSCYDLFFNCAQAFNQKIPCFLL